MKDKVVLITGGSSGIGKALAMEFGKNGAKIMITGRNLSNLQQTVEELRKLGIDIHATDTDVSIEEDNKKMVLDTVNIFGKIDVLICNAGITMRALFQDLDLEVIKKLMDINFYGLLYSTKACLPEILKSKGSIIGISSIAGYRGLPGRTGYSASKFAMNGFLESLRTEMLNTGVHVLTACPGYTTSNIRKNALTKDGLRQGESPRDENKMMSAEKCAKHIYNATVRRKNILILTAQGRFIIWLNKFFPRLADKLVYSAISKEGKNK